MPQPTPARSTPLKPSSARTPSIRQVQLVAGLVLFTYVTLHFANHALGNISIEAMENGLKIQKSIWQSFPGAIVLYSALTVHMVLGFWALYERRHFRWTRIEAAQLALGRCHVAMAKSTRGLRLTHFQAAATASRHVVIAAARSTR